MGRYKAYGMEFLTAVSSNLFGDKSDEGRILAYWNFSIRVEFPKKVKDIFFLQS